MSEEIAKKFNKQLFKFLKQLRNIQNDEYLTLCLDKLPDILDNDPNVIIRYYLVSLDNHLIKLSKGDIDFLFEGNIIEEIKSNNQIDNKSTQEYDEIIYKKFNLIKNIYKNLDDINKKRIKTYIKNLSKYTLRYFDKTDNTTY